MDSVASWIWVLIPLAAIGIAPFKMWLKVNGATRQDGSTATMVYGVAHLVSYLSGFMTLHPGDIISTGTLTGAYAVKPGEVWTATPSDIALEPVTLRFA